MTNPSDHKNRRVLVVDDNRAIHDDFRKILSPPASTESAFAESRMALFGDAAAVEGPARFDVDSAYQGQEGLMLVKKAREEGRPYALAFVDVRMPPGWDGIETTQKVWEIDPEIQIVICTAYSDYSWGELFDQVGNRDGLLILKKPFDAVEALQLAHALTEKWWLARESARKMEELEVMVGGRTRELRETNSALQTEVEDHRRAEEELRGKTAFLEAQVNSSSDGILVVDDRGKKALQNQRMGDLLGIPSAIAEDKDDKKQLEWVTGAVKNPAQFIERVLYLNSHRDQISRDELELNNGTILDRYSSPVVGGDGKYYGRIWTFRDITEQRRVEHELKEARIAAVLRESAQRYNFLADTVPLIIWTARPDGCLDYYNKTWFDYTGLSLAQTRDWGWGAVVHPDDLQLCIGRWTRSFTTGEIYEIEYRFKRAADGLYRWFLGRASALRDDAGQIVQWVGTCTDIDDQKRAEAELRQAHSTLEARVAERTAELARTNEALQASETRFRAFFEQAAVGVAHVALDGRFVLTNQRFADILGRTCEELQSCTLREVTQEEESGDGSGDTERLVAGAIQTYTTEKRYLRKDGSSVWCNVTASMAGDSPGKPKHFLLVIQDISDRKRSEESLRMLSSAVEQSKESIIITDAEINLPGPRILFVNPAFTRMSGYTAEEAMGGTPRILQGPRTDRAVLVRLRQNLERGEVFEGETVNYRKGGGEFDIEWQIAPIRGDGGKVTHFVAIQRDVTERKQLEARLLQSQKLETVGKLAGGIAHEFNSILTAILGQSELLLGELPIGSSLAKSATEISRAADRAATLTRQLLAYGRKQFLQPETLDLNRVILGMDSMLRYLIGGGINLRIISADGLKAVRADAGQIEQVIMNLAVNAREAMPNGGKLTLETANLSLAGENMAGIPDLKPGNYVMLAITDTGAGMTAEVKAHAFEPFFTTKDVGQGSGLGLSTCYGIIKQSGGHITVESEAGRGAMFKIYLPQLEAQPEAPSRRSPPAELPHGTETIMIVQSDPDLRELSARLLKRLGYTVLVAADGIEALGLTKRDDSARIDLMFTDAVMPRMSGRELADLMRGLSPRTKILFASTDSGKATTQRDAQEIGAEFLEKPYTPSAMVRKVREMLDQTPPG